MRTRTKILLSILITFVLTASISVFGAIQYISKYKYEFEKLDKVMAIVEQSYVGEYDTELCEEGAIHGLLMALGDDYATYYNEKNAKETMQMVDGYYVGIGIEVLANFDKGYMEIVSAFEDSPADRAGMKSGDLIKKIDGVEYDVTKMADAILYMKGSNIENPLEQTMEITVIRGEEELVFNLKREKIDMYKVTYQMVDDICYIRYTGFTDDSQQQLKKIVEGLDNNTAGVVIDLRNNPGGEFGSSINMSDLFLDNGTIMYTLDKSGKKTEYTALEGSTDLPLAVLVNGSTASASEIFAGAMQDHNRAVIVGEKTYGKGVTQTIMYLNSFDPSEGALKITTYKNYTPNGKWINESITPDIIIENPEINEDITQDEAFIAAVNSLKKDK